MIACLILFFISSSYVATTLEIIICTPFSEPSVGTFRFQPAIFGVCDCPQAWCSTYQRGEMFSCRWTTSGQQPAAQSTPRRSRLRRHRRILLSCSHSTSTTIPQIQGYWYPVLRVSIWLERFDRRLQGGDDVHYAREPAVREEMTVARTEPSPA